MIGLSETAEQYQRRGYTGERQARGYRSFRHRGMPFATEPRERPHATWPMCRVVVAARRLVPEREWGVFRALQFAQFTSTLVLDEPEGHRAGAGLAAGDRRRGARRRVAGARDRGAVRRRPRARRARPPAGRPSSRAARRPRPRARSATPPRADLHRRRRRIAGGRRLPADRGLRRGDREPRPVAEPARAAPRTSPRCSRRSRTG